ncbi:PaaI family thioesterase [Erythrobacter rubeus]|uniref:PaaI family thioesterase n=1 Tax=Erythrobacter rubeus TaxID=2760803 RepID=A0ABR8KSC0_9SPHN|nr:PaaI family thioesterase [Erythrobacter rubeus]MBD2842317.1 PaaI family thioesterase [Erythrobacter rubeus]
MSEIELPPYARALGIEVSGDEGGAPILTVQFGSSVEGRPKHYHGGAIAGLLENAGYGALRARLKEEGREAQLKPVNITVQYLSAGKSQPSFAIGQITRLGRRNANISVEAWQDDRDKPIATAVMNILMA